MIEVSWATFNQKFKGREQAVFEEACYQIFCNLTGNRDGIFRFKNHPGIETIDVLFKNKYTGFQAKYFQDDLSNHKNDYLETIAKTRKHNSRVQRIIYFLPNDPGCNSKGKDGSLKPQWMQEVEQEAINNNLEIEWFGLSRFQSYFAREEHQYLARHLFDTNPDLWDCIGFLKARTQSRLEMIHSEIVYHGQYIHIDYTDIVQKLSSIPTEQIAIVSGPGGIGKTALIKDWFAPLPQDNTLAILLQPWEIIDYLTESKLRQNWHSTIKEFFLKTKEFSKCILVIDATEKIADNSQLSELLMIVKVLCEANWKIVCTIRTLYLKQWINLLNIYLHQTTIETINIPSISQETLTQLAERYQFNLPDNPHVFQHIQIPFNLFAYLSCENSSGSIATNVFEDMIWNHFVQGETVNDSAGNAFCHLVKAKLASNARFIDSEESTEDIKKLIERGIIVPFEGTSKYEITHDIYEEWAIIKIFNGQKYTLSQYEFEQFIQSSYSLRRGFRIWLDSRIQVNDTSILTLLESDSDIIIAEFLLALVFSFNLDIFLQNYSSLLFRDNGLLFNKLVSCMYHIGRTETINPLLLGRQEPLKDSWQILINFAYRHLQDVIKNNLQPFLSLMLDWSLVYSTDDTTKICFVICWKVVERQEQEKRYYNGREHLLIKVIAATSLADRDAFVSRMNEHLRLENSRRGCLLDEFCEEILKTTDSAYSFVIKHFPKMIIQIAWKYWRHNHVKDYYGEFDFDKVEHACGLSTRFHYLPVSFLQTPTYQLLRADPFDTVEFITEFTNTCISDYVQNNCSESLETLDIQFPNGQSVKQYVSTGLWNMYRGSSRGEHWPYLLQSMHMALEHYCLELMSNIKDESKEDIKTVVNLIIVKILSKSISASLTAVVVSIVNAFPNDFSNIALLLLPVKKIVSFDFARAFCDQQPDYVKLLIPLPQTEHDIIREKYDNHPCREKNLEQVALQYQLFPPKDNSKIKERIEQIIDKLAEDFVNLPIEEQYSILRMDARRQTIKSYKNENNQIVVIGTPHLTKAQEDDQIKRSNSIELHNKAARLINWAKDNIYGATQNNQIYASIDDVLLDFDEIQTLCTIEDYEKNLFYVPAIRMTAAALVIRYSEQIEHNRLNQCFQIFNDALSVLIYGNRMDSSFYHVDSVLIATPYMLKKTYFIKRWQLKKMFILSLLVDDNISMSNNYCICDFGFNGIRSYLATTNDTILLDQLRQRYIEEFRRYYAFLKEFRTFKRSSRLVRTIKKMLCKIFKFFHLSYPQWLNPNEYYSPETTSIQHPISKYQDCFWARNRIFISPDKEIEAHLQCNLIQFINPNCITAQEENDIINGLDLCLDYLFPLDEERKLNTPSYLYWARDKYLQQLSLCVLNMTDNGRMKFIKALMSNSHSHFNTDFINQLILAEDTFPHPKAFWLIMKSLLPNANNELDKYSCLSTEYHDLLDALSLTSIKWKTDAQTWKSFCEDTIDYFQLMVKTCGSHRYLAVCICKFTNGIGQDYILNSISWISSILHQAKEEYDDNEITKLFINAFEKLIPQIEKRIESILSNQYMKLDLTTILDYLIIHNSLPAFKLRETIL